MKLRDYILGLRKGKEARRIELEAMKDPFLKEALEGYDQSKTDRESLEIRFEAMQQRIRRRTRTHTLSRIATVAACLLTLLGLGGYLLYFNDPAAIYQNEIAYSVPPERMSEEMPEMKDADELSMESQKQRSVSDYQAASEPLQKSRPHRANEPMLLAKHHQLPIPEAVPFIDMPQEEEPKPASGIKAYKRYIVENQAIPAFDECARIKGNVTIAFRVNALGRPYDFDVRESLCPTADREALRLIYEGPAWTAGDKEVNLTIRF